MYLFYSQMFGWIWMGYKLSCKHISAIATTEFTMNKSIFWDPKISVKKEPSTYSWVINTES